MNSTCSPTPRTPGATAACSTSTTCGTTSTRSRTIFPWRELLTDYSTFRWRDRDFFILPTPGHTLGSITLLTTIDGKRVAFSGDLMYSPGQDWSNLYDTQINYGGAEGIDLGHLFAGPIARAEP